MGRVEVVVMRLVLGAGPVAQHLQALTVVQRPAQQRRDARLDAPDQVRFTALEEHAVAGARGIHLAAFGAGRHGLGARQARAGQRDDAIAFRLAQQVGEHHHAWLAQGHHDLDRPVTRHHHRRKAAEVGLGQAGRGLHRRRQRGGLAQRAGQGLAGDDLVPAAADHRRQDAVCGMPGLVLLGDPRTEFGGDDLLAHGWRRKTRRSGAEASGAKR
mmetsp:Transcript_41204/g.96288  ORF Transcript_41204/g.96288 Transcript_41204/m.96288 type:complete len:214 (+) Transcript_41204:327-968(+)